MGAIETETTTGNTANVDVAFADVLAGPNDAARDGQHSDFSDFIVASAQISMGKTSVVISDPVNGTVNPLAIPGATVQYTVTIANAAGASTSATLTTITDALDANVRVDSAVGVAAWTVTGSTRAATSGTLTVDTTDANGDGLGHSDVALPGGTLTAALTTILAADAVNGYVAGEVKPGEVFTLTFNVIIQ
jgi:hypothetical protein